ncbi:TetR family transcriptional regulator [Frankia sp. CNm7]|uniref:TetR family transcriptional regulator n=1 Tax=Frankia nepalensis TaxID=1836974 RepID=A0A937UMJ9_9ACTN|nr:TetR/AcrR family transcriptional regulator [Frankia nepalensis]MBL7495035.1 TetR family transcriptional regulator [Frankia nepalensis]MBL7511107.1 TetR family transcriptional regulator [Frankia nepalensis]MBL7521878.1 TetR family transcriptional regulator [Frankia nepalensis]MBL7626927.1 TetR family transcriptional regulator [Frankia nepalensis]
MPRDVGVRVQARQARSVATFERILEAAGELFDEVGVDATTMEAIADRAGVSIGSVYRFFANKNALKETLTARWVDRIRGSVEPALLAGPAAAAGAGPDQPDRPDGPDGVEADGEADTTAGSDADTAAGIDESVDQFVAVLRQVLDELPGARGLLATTLREPPGETRQWIAYLERYIARHAPDLPPARQAVAARAYLTITSALILAAVDAGPELGAHLDEVRTVLAGYTRELARASELARAARDDATG